METLISIVSIILLLGLVLAPIFVYVSIIKWLNLKYNFVTYLIGGFVLTAGIMLTFAWWADYSDQLLMRHYGYDFEAINGIERFANVQAENLEKVKQLEIGYFGIGWPLKAIISYTIYSPYLLVVYFIGSLVKNLKFQTVKPHLRKHLE